MERNIILDFDGVLFDTWGGFISYYNTKYNTSFSRDEVSAYGLEKLFGKSQDDVSKDIDYFIKGAGDDLPLFDGAINGVKELSAFGKLHVATARLDVKSYRTNELIKRHFGDYIQSVLFAFDIYNQHRNTERKKKFEICKDIDAKLIIEDDINYAKSCAENGINTFLLSNNNVHEKLHSNITIVRDWEEVVEKASEMFV